MIKVTFGKAGSLEHVILLEEKLNGLELSLGDSE